MSQNPGFPYLVQMNRSYQVTWTFGLLAGINQDHQATSWGFCDDLAKQGNQKYPTHRESPSVRGRHLLGQGKRVLLSEVFLATEKFAEKKILCARSRSSVFLISFSLVEFML